MAGQSMGAASPARYIGCQFGERRGAPRFASTEMGERHWPKGRYLLLIILLWWSSVWLFGGKYFSMLTTFSGPSDPSTNWPTTALMPSNSPTYKSL